MVRFLTLLASGLSLGGVYALVSLGFVLVFKSTRVLNLAMGEFLMVGAYLGFFFISHLGWPFIPALVAVAIPMAWTPGRGLVVEGTFVTWGRSLTGDKSL